MIAWSRFGGIFDYDAKKERLEEVSRELESPDIWDKPDYAQQLGRERALLEKFVGGIAGVLAMPLDPGRLEQELVIWLQKLDVDEELDRLDAHVAEARRVLGLREAVGRRLDFLLQEFNREANTLGSKSVDARSSAAAVELKVLIDQVREQVQNIE